MLQISTAVFYVGKQRSLYTIEPRVDFKGNALKVDFEGLMVMQLML